MTECMTVNTTLPKGSIDADVYIVTGNPTENDIKVGYALSGDIGACLLKILGTNNLISNTRINSISNTILANKKEYPNYLVSNLMPDLLQCHPKVIVTLGADVSKLFLGDKFTTMKRVNGKVFDINLYGFRYSVIPTYSVDQLIFSHNDIRKNIDLAFKNTSLFIDDKYSTQNKTCKYILTYEDFEVEYISNYKDCTLLSYDIETNAESPLSKSFEIIGFSQAKSCNEGMYVCMKSLDKNMHENDIMKCKTLLRESLSEHKTIVHNSMYERPCTLKELDYELPFEGLEDTLAMSRLLMGGKSGSGLKAQAQSLLGYENWDNDLVMYMKYTKSLLSVAISRHSLLTTSFKDFLNIDKGVWSQNFTNDYAAWMSLCGEYYSEVECENLIQLLWDNWATKYISLGEMPSVLPYNILPYRLLCEYGAMDSIATYDLFECLSKKLDSESNDKVDLHKGYEYMLEQMYAGYVLERNGVVFDEEQAAKDKEYYTNVGVVALKSMLLSSKVKGALIQQARNLYLPMILSDYYPEIPLLSGYTVAYNRKTKTHSVSLLGKRRKKEEVFDINIPSTYNKQIDELVYKFVVDTINSSETVEELKEIYTPGSEKQDSIPNAILINDDLHVANSIFNLNSLYESEKYMPILAKYVEAFELNAGDISLFGKIKKIHKRKADKNILAELDSMIGDVSNKVLLSIILDNKVYNKTSIVPYNLSIENLGGRFTPSKVQLLYNIAYTLELNDKDIELLELSHLICDKKQKDYIVKRDNFNKFKMATMNTRSYGNSIKYWLKLEMEESSFKDEHIINLYNRYLLQGINPDDPTTWTEEFVWLINFRTFKKTQKLITSYIDGKVGRDSVSIVKQDELLNSNKVLRQCKYGTRNKESDEAYLLTDQLGVCTTETFRWRCGLHTLPAGRAIKKLYRSRYKGGTIFMPDFSQQEVRVLAGISQCGNMINAFKDGVDIHMKSAEVIFNKPESEILPVERRFAKAATFGILYGQTEESFAREYLDDNVEKAKQIFEGFYRAYPEIKIWMDATHQEYLATGKVSTMTGQFIDIQKSENVWQESANLRKAQNYPIQCSATTIAGSVLYEVCKYVDKNNLKSKPFLFIHDSLEIDVHPLELINMAVKIKAMLVDLPMDKFNLPAKADLALGCSLGHEIEVKDITDVSTDMTMATIILEGYADEIQETVSNWKEVYNTAEILEYYVYDLDSNNEVKRDIGGNKIKKYNTWETEHCSYSELFMPKRAFNPLMGQTRQKGCAVVRIKYYG